MLTKSFTINYLPICFKGIGFQSTSVTYEMGWFEKLSRGKKRVMIGGAVAVTFFLLSLVKPYNEHQRYQRNKRDIELLLKRRREVNSSEGIDSVSDVK